MGKKLANRKEANPTTRMTSGGGGGAEMQLDQRGDGLYSGTFRWTDSKAFPSLPPRPLHGSGIPTEPLESGWQGYLAKCHTAHNLVPMATQDPSFLDALSFPMTFVYAAKTLGLIARSTSNDQERRHVVVVGATVKAEQRIFHLTSYWDEVAAFFPGMNHRSLYWEFKRLWRVEFRITLWFVGPEVDSTRDPTSKASPLNVHFVQDTAGAFLAGHPALTAHNSVLVGYNTGFGNFVESNRYDLLWSWLPDLVAIADSGIPSIFACANDYAEFAIQSRVVGANMVLLPKENPFSAASHLHEEGKKESAWSRANSFLYVIQGADSSRRHNLKHGDVMGLNARLDQVLNLHYEDRLGRHFFLGMILSKDQAARSKLLQKLHGPDNQAMPSPAKQAVVGLARTSDKDLSTVTQAMSKVVVSDAAGNQINHDITQPEYTIMSNAAKTDMRITVSMPRMESAQDLQLDLSKRTLQVIVPSMYLLEMHLPWDVATSRDSMQAVYVKKSRTLCIELRSGYVALKDTLEARGSMGQIRARIRAEIFQALDEGAPKAKLSNENLIINELIREYMEYNGYRHALSVFVPESGQPLPRTLGIPKFPCSTASSLLSKIPNIPRKSSINHHDPLCVRDHSQI
ncbi:hypothetical protein DYB36_007738 [Aphanomyces astaci]|uniref:Uncharacterized protein n=1 Tax=Aphanomyces astaci TaxID=112090 RepID=A0A396ZXS6_APHAT|nr:hypothetical protein DYB36_007738 [Aphanomyces astaci]